MISWADTERDLSAWLGNAMQSNALHELYKLEGPLKEKGDQDSPDRLAQLTAATISTTCAPSTGPTATSQIFQPLREPLRQLHQFHERSGQYPDAPAPRDKTNRAGKRLRQNSSPHCRGQIDFIIVGGVGIARCQLRDGGARWCRLRYSPVVHTARIKIAHA